MIYTRLKFAMIPLICIQLISIIGIAQNCTPNSMSNYKKMEYYFANAKHLFEVSKQNNVVKMETSISNGTKVTMYQTCKNDTMFLTRDDLIINAENGMFVVYGQQSIPLQLKVGDKLDPYKDYMISTPITKEGFVLVSTSKSNFFASGNSYFMETIIKTYNVQSKTDISMNTEYINYVNAKVVSEEQITISGKTFTAYKIEHEQWVKPNLNVKVNYNTDGISGSKQAKDQEAKTNKLLEKKLTKVSKSMSNKEGYMVTPKTDWFVPGIGIVKTYTYNEGRMFEKDKAYLLTLSN